MKKLIVNADDFGLHTQINNGIIKGYKEGFISSASIMPGAPAWQEAVDLAHANPGLGIGIHLTLVGGIPPVLPLEKVSSLVDDNGLLFSNYGEFAKKFYFGEVLEREIEAELRAQIERVIDADLNFTHLDSHQHIHVLPGLNRLVLKLCSEYNIKRMRIPFERFFFTGGFQASVGRYIGRSGLSFCALLAANAAKRRGIVFPDHFFGMLAGGHLNAYLVGNIIKSLPEGVSEIMTHPGIDSNNLDSIFHWHYHWQDELSAYLSKENKMLLKTEGIVLINFAMLY